jgi:hypothetical protein
VWYASAFPLLLRHHLPVQAAFCLTYAARLTRTACANFPSVHNGAAATRWLRAAMRRLSAATLAAHGARAGSLDAAVAISPPVAAPGDALTPGGSSGGSRAGCGAEGRAAGEGREPALTCATAVVFVQLAAGVLLPWFVVYCIEARARAAWLRRERAAARRHCWRADAAAAAAAAAAAGPLDGVGPSSSPACSLAVMASGSGSGSGISSFDLLPLPDPPPQPLAAAGEAGGAFACLAPAAVPEPPGCAELYLLVAALVGAWVLATGALPVPALLRRAGLSWG